MVETVEQIGERVAYEYAAYRGEEGGCPHLRVLIGRVLTAERQRAETAEAEIAKLKEMLRPGSPTERAPTQWAYDAACAALHKHKKRADELAAKNAALREALEALRLQALQSDINNPANEYGWSALQQANGLLAFTPATSLAALEKRVMLECAEIADREYGGFTPDNDHGLGYKRACENVAAAIRKLAEER